MKKHPVLFSFLILSVLGFFFFIFVVCFALFSNSNLFLNGPVAVVKIEGPIFESIKILRELEDIRLDDEVKTVVLRLDSPGGAVAPSQEIMEQVLKLKKNKKVIVSMGTVAASGAYYIASAADKIVASSGTVTGSIGVIMESFGLKELAQKFHVEHRVLKSGKFKDVGNPFSDLTEEGVLYLQNLIDNMYAQFLNAVSVNRNIPLEKVKELAEGKIYTGLQAKEAGLVDQLGNLFDAILLAKELSGLPVDADVSWPREPSGFEKFFGGEDAESLLKIFSNGFLDSMPLWILK
jgi:protease-4